MSEERTCCQKMWRKHRFYSAPIPLCGKRASVERDGKWYCKMHDPKRVKERNEKRYREFEARMNAESWWNEERELRLAIADALLAQEDVEPLLADYRRHVAEKPE